ncbi:MAG: lipid II flippase MurJ [Alphaproteobacteria bacterium]
MIIASFLGAGSISYLYADRLNQLPLGVVGIAVGTALLPMLSKAFYEVMWSRDGIYLTALWRCVYCWRFRRL